MYCPFSRKMIFSDQSKVILKIYLNGTMALKKMKYGVFVDEMNFIDGRNEFRYHIEK